MSRFVWSIFIVQLAWKDMQSNVNWYCLLWTRFLSTPQISRFPLKKKRKKKVSFSCCTVHFYRLCLRFVNLKLELALLPLSKTSVAGAGLCLKQRTCSCCWVWGWKWRGMWTFFMSVSFRTWLHVASFHLRKLKRTIICTLPNGDRSWDCAPDPEFVGSVSVSFHLMERSEQHLDAVSGC